MKDFTKIKAQFPVFVSNPNLVYLDSAATTLKPKCVIDAINDYYSNCGANVHRGMYDLSEKATDMYENARKTVQKFINAKSEREIIFTSGTTESINFVALGWGRQNLKSGDEIILSALEHHSNLLPWQKIAKEKNCTIKFIDINKNGILNFDHFSKLLTRKTKIVALTHVSNVLGTINPIKKFIQKAHANSSKVLIDAAQSAPHMPLDVQSLDCDFLAFSGHKMGGPTGIGILYAKEKILNSTEPLFTGGSMTIEVTETRAKWNDIPWKFEAGTPPIAQAIGLGSAINWLNAIGMEEIQNHDAKLLEFALCELGKIKGIKLYGPCDPKIQSSTISFNLEGVHPHDLAEILNSENIAIRAGHHCCMPLMEALKTQATARISFYVYNTEGDIKKLVLAINKAQKIFAI